MRIINWYVSRTLLTVLIMALGITSFVLVLGHLAKVFHLLSLGVDLPPLLRFVLYKMPEIFSYTLPISLLLATVLVFNRLSADHEITALRASGISVLQVSVPVVLLSIVFSASCYFLQFHLAPEYDYRARSLRHEESIKNPLAFLEQGHFIEMFRGYLIAVDQRVGNEMRNVHIYELDEAGNILKHIIALRGTITVRDREKLLDLEMKDATIEIVDPEHRDEPEKVTRMSGTYKCSLDFGQGLNQRRLVRRVDNMTLPQLWSHWMLYRERGLQTTPFAVELHKRAALALAPFTFVLLGLPLGLVLQRRERSPGIVIALLVILGYYGGLTIIETLGEGSRSRPELLMWLPNLIGQAWGLFLLWRRR